MKKLHIGCGRVILPGWTNVDIEDVPGVDLIADARDLGVIDQESVDIIYASHILDHFSRNEVDDVLKLWYSKLRPGGTLRLAVSDFGAAVAEYTARPVGERDVSQLLGHIVGGHKSPYDRHGVVFDEASLRAALERAGFRDIRLWDWRETDHATVDDFSQAYLPHMQKETGRLMSLNMEATRPQPTRHHLSDVGRAFYLAQIEKHGLSARGSVPDEYIRLREQRAIMEAIRAIDPDNILEVGCGSGLLLQALYDFGQRNVDAFDGLPEFVALAESRNLPYRIWLDDVRAISGGLGAGTSLEGEQYDAVISQRVVINLLSQADQARAFAEIKRMVRPGGWLVLVEAFADAWRNLNEARAEFELAAHPMATHNRWLERAEFEAYTKDLQRVDHIGDVRVQPQNFLSSYFYASRVLHDVARIGAGFGEEPPLRASNFVRFLGEALPPAGDYANIQFYVFHKPRR